MPHRHLQGHGLRVHGGSDALVEDPPQTGFDQGAVVMHAALHDCGRSLPYGVPPARRDPRYNSPPAVPSNRNAPAGASRKAKAEEPASRRTPLPRPAPAN
ncbi:hypothetical protein GCM10019016_122120 [Streptomyces prasinosporus]|uniref:HD domain-containing protein n=1 Tax=Streptomyces prasinosporus TaxID=68256 RepID=A0ABP6UEZ6_9ACTN|nr:hypothetical protein GCM10010332_04920 [Streptomyces albogriseolus]